MDEDELEKKTDLEKRMERKIDRLILLGVVILLLVVIVIGILIRGQALY